MHHKTSSCLEELTRLQCAVIQKSHPDLVFLGTQGTFDFWDTKQHNDIPACRAEPSTPAEVSEVLKIAVQEQCHFAVKGGGHSRIAGSSNAKGGITIDLVKFKDVTIAKDRKSVKIGGGALWLDVYSTLEKENLAVVGGRVHDVGVGGLTLGGEFCLHVVRIFETDFLRRHLVLLRTPRLGLRQCHLLLDSPAGRHPCHSNPEVAPRPILGTTWWIE